MASKSHAPEGIATRSKKCLTEVATSKNKQLSSKRSEVHNPRIARRMKKISEASESAAYACAICLSPAEEEEIGRLECRHEFCMPCLIKWWRHHPTCPCCREEIVFISCGEQIVYFCDLPPEEIDESQPFIAHCELCWGEIEDHEPMNICTVCRSVYWHSRCLPFSSKKWYCLECAGEADEEKEDGEDH
jgi:hypothetical protein